MKLVELDLRAFGPFTNRKLRFSTGERSFDIIFGRNEAGKSSALRAIYGLLFGIPERTTDNFLHRNQDLRIAGVLEHTTLGRLSLMRRKSRKNSLQNPNDESPLDESVLARFLGPVTRDLFATLFGIDHDALVRGGEEILSQKGEVGKILFSAAQGITSLRGVMEQLTSEAEELFLPRGSSQAIPRACREYEETQRKMKEALLKPSDWEMHSNALHQAKAEASRLDKKLAGLKMDRSKLERLRRALRPAAQRKALLDEKNALGSVVRLPEDFQDRRQVALTRREQARNALQKDQQLLEALKKERAKIEVPAAVLKHADLIEQLHIEVGKYQKAAADHPVKLQEKEAHWNRTKKSAEMLRPGGRLDEFDALRPAILQVKPTVTRLEREHAALKQRLKLESKRVNEGKEKVRSLEDRLRAMPPAPDVSALRKLRDVSRKAGDLDGELEKATLRVRKLLTYAQEKLASLRRYWSGQLEDIPRLSIPSNETIDRFEQKFSKLEKQKEKLQEKIDSLAQKREDSLRELRELERADQVPSEADLKDARARRDDLWTKLKSAVASGKIENWPSDCLKYEGSVSTADDVADRLRREADKVRRRAQLQAEVEELTRRQKVLKAEDRALRKQRNEVKGEWRSEWEASAISPATPPEMRAWRRDFESLKETYEAAREAEDEAQTVAQKITTTREQLAQELSNLGEEPEGSDKLSPILDQTDALIARVDAEASARREVEKELEQARQQLEKALSSLAEAEAEERRWSEEWKETMARLELPEEVSPEGAVAMIEQFEEIFHRLDEAEKLDQKILEIEQVMKRFKENVERVSGLLGMERAGSRPDETASSLFTLLQSARKAETRRQELDRQILETRKRIAEARAELKHANQVVTNLLKEAGASSEEELPEIERRSQRLANLEREIKQVEQTLLDIAEGAPVEKLVEEALGKDPDSIALEISEIDRKIEEKQELRNRWAEVIGAEDRERSRMDGTSKAAELQARSKEILVGLREDVERYMRLRLAATLLSEEVERYRAQNQDPLLARAGELFSKITCGAFSGIRADFDDKGTPILISIRGGDTPQRVGVEGLSSGTRDQLYLALRLATLERYIDSNEPMPFIVDDILINFDDERCRAALEVLADLSTKTQVLLFTHHSRVVDIAGSLNGNREIRVIEL